nr:glycosyltransferase family 2 protein [Terribacillus saccharophilus]
MKVSIILPTYNVEKYIEQCLDSIYQQTYTNYELIIVDDASTDRTPNIIAELANEKTKVIINKLNKGPSYSRNLALNAATGDFIAFIDSDDWWATSRLKSMIEYLKDDFTDIVWDNLNFIEEDSLEPWTTFRRKNKFIDGDLAIDLNLFTELDLGLLKPIIKRSIISNNGLLFNEDFKYGEDFLFFFECLSKANKGILLTESYYFYRAREGSLVTQSENFYADLLSSTRCLIENSDASEEIRLLLKNRFNKISTEKSIWELKRKGIINLVMNLLKNPLKIRYVLIALSRKIEKRKLKSLQNV